MANTRIRVTAKEAQETHGIGRARIRKMRQRGRIEPCGKSGRADLFDLDELLAVPRDGRPRDELGRFVVAELVDRVAH